jgi:hypothetical protein
MIASTPCVNTIRCSPSRLSPRRGGESQIWTGEVQPLHTDELLYELVDDLDRNRPVYLPGGGRVIHHPHCIVSKHMKPRWMNKIVQPSVRYSLKIQYRGGPDNPRAYVNAPCLFMKNGQFRWMHMLEDGAICAYAPHHNLWHWQLHTVVDFMSYVLIWLVKWTVWDQTSVWIGAEEPHDAHSLFRNIKSTSPCRCGSGKEYGGCHRKADQACVEQNPESKISLSQRIAEIYPRLFP